MTVSPHGYKVFSQRGLLFLRLREIDMRKLGGRSHLLTYLVGSLQSSVTPNKTLNFGIAGQYNDHLAALPKRPRAATLTPIVNRLATFIIALIGGVSLVAPMVVLVYLRSMTLKTVAISVSVLIFAAILAVFTQAKNQELLAATAAYAAVLVVFVGSPSSPAS